MHSFYQRTFGIGPRVAFVMACFAIILGFLKFYANGELIYSVQFGFLAIMFLTYSRAVKHPFLLLDENEIGMRYVSGTSYQITKKDDIANIQVSEKKIILLLKVGKKIVLHRWLFKKNDWPEITKLLEQYVK